MRRMQKIPMPKRSYASQKKIISFAFGLKYDNVGSIEFLLILRTKASVILCKYKQFRRSFFYNVSEELSSICYFLGASRMV